MIRTKKTIVLDGKNIFLRSMKISDATQEYVNWLNDPEVNQYLESRFVKSTIKSVRDYIQKVIHNSDNIIFLVIVLKNTNKHIGNIKLVIDQRHKFGDIGIIIGDKNSWGKGYASEAIHLLTKFSFNTLKLHKLIAGAYNNNIGSINVFIKNGFIIEGVQKNQFLSGNKYVDGVLLARFSKKL